MYVISALNNKKLLFGHSISSGFFCLFFYKFIYFLAVLGLHCCARPFSSCGELGRLFVVVRRLLVVVASLVAEHGL